MYKEQQQKRIPPERQEKERWGEYPYIAWTGSSQEIPVVRFQANAVVSSDHVMRKVGEYYHLYYKISPHASPLIHQILSGHGFRNAKEPGESSNLMWMRPRIEFSTFENLKSFQKINHFPNSQHLGRKDLLNKNIERMQMRFGSQRFNFLPKSYVLPEQYDKFSEAMSKEKGFWIKKPVNSSQGLGIKVISSPHEVSKAEEAVVSQYIANPFLVNGYKFDFRIYVLVTSYNPLTIYMFKEGLTRFATEKYNLKDLKKKGEFNKFMHLTNSSVNKKSPNYIINSDQQNESGNSSMWTFSAMLRYLKEVEQIDTEVLMSQIEDTVIKTIISVTGPIGAACRSTVPHRNNCFELYGFDILIDENLKPWLLEVNLAPALTCANPMDTKVKVNLVADTLTLVGVECKNPEHKNAAHDRPLGNYAQSRDQEQTIRDEEARRGGFNRIFPRRDSLQRYGPLLEHPALYNQLCKRLFGQELTGPKTSKIEVKPNMKEYERMLTPIEVDVDANTTNNTSLPPIRGAHKMAQLKVDTSVGPRQHILQTVQKLTFSCGSKKPTIPKAEKLTPFVKDFTTGTKRNIEGKVNQLPLLKKDMCSKTKQPTTLKARELPPLIKDISIGVKQQPIPKPRRLPPLQPAIRGGTRKQTAVKGPSLPRSMK